MAFSLKTWVNRISEYPNRRKLTHEDGSTELVTVARAEGQISAEGNAFSAEEMNDLENRIKGGFDEVNQSLTNIKFMPRYDSVIGTMTSPSQEYECAINCFLIGTIKAVPNGWAGVRSKSNTNYFLALETNQKEIGVCIPFKKGDTIVLSSTGAYNLGVARAD